MYVCMYVYLAPAWSVGGTNTRNDREEFEENRALPTYSSQCEPTNSHMFK